MATLKNIALTQGSLIRADTAALYLIRPRRPIEAGRSSSQHRQEEPSMECVATRNSPHIIASTFKSSLLRDSSAI